MTKRDTQKAATRERITSAARDEFAVSGYEHATTRGIARRAGCSTGAIFANWPDKGALWRDVMNGQADFGRLCAVLWGARA